MKYFFWVTLRQASGLGGFWLDLAQPFLCSDCSILAPVNPTLLTSFFRARKEKAHQLTCPDLYSFISPTVSKRAQGNPSVNHRGEAYGRRVNPRTILWHVSYISKLLLSVSFAIQLLSLLALTTTFADTRRQAPQFMTTNGNLHEQAQKIVLISLRTSRATTKRDACRQLKMSEDWFSQWKQYSSCLIFVIQCGVNIFKQSNNWTPIPLWKKVK